MAECSKREEYDHTRLELVPTSLYEHYIDELFCTESSSEAGSCCSYTDLFHHVGSYELTNGSLNLAFSQLPLASATAPPTGQYYCNLESSILAWSDATGLPPTVSVHVAGQVFKLHKFPLVSLSGYMKKELMESEEVHLDKGRWWPGGVESFEVAASFCYGGRVALSPTNVAVVRCAAEVLEMSEEYTQGNLARRCDVYLRQVALRRWRHALLVLRQCESLRPLAESLHIVADCVDALATMACGQAVNAIESYPLVDGMHSASCLSATSFPANFCDNISNSPRTHRHCDPSIHSLRRHKGGLVSQNTLSASDCLCFTLQQLAADDQLAWIHDLSELPHYQFSPIIRAAHRLGMRGKHIALVLLQYAEKSIFSCFEVLEEGVLEKKQDTEHVIACSKYDGLMQDEEIVEKIEAMVALLEDAAISCNQEAERRERFSMIRFLFGLLKCAHACGGGSMQANQCKQKLECMIKQRLKHASISDFELPCSLLREAAGGGGGSHSCSKKAKVYSEDQRRRRDQKEVESMLHIFTLFFSSRVQCVGADKLEAEGWWEVAQVAELWDEYMAEAAKEAELTVHMFVQMAEVVPPSARQCHDRLYAAVDAFFQSHPSVSPQERQVACKVLNCQKLSQACCIQAVQNETMPLRIIVQAMFMHQLNTATTTTPVLQRSASCYHHHHQDANTPNPQKMTHQLGFLLKANSVGKHCQPMMSDATLDDPEALNTRLLTLEDEIQQIKQGLAGFRLTSSCPQTSPTTTRAKGWRPRFPCLNGFFCHASSPRLAPLMSKSHQSKRRSIHVQPACCLAQPSSSKHLHSF